MARTADAAAAPVSFQGSTPEPRTPENKPFKSNTEAQMTCLNCSSQSNCDLHIFRLLDLPTELRLAIYRKALWRPNPINLASKLPPRISKSTTKRFSGPPFSQDDDEEIPLEVVPSRGNRHFRNYPPSQTVESYDINSEKNKRLPKPHPDPLSPALLAVSKQVYHEALAILYRENTFNLDLHFSMLPLTQLRQRIRSLISRAVVPIEPWHDDINNDLYKLFTHGLRYCFNVEKLEIVSHVRMPEKDRQYTLAFHVLRWLPKNCVVEIRAEGSLGSVSEGVRQAIEEQNLLSKELDLQTYYRRQNQTYYLERNKEREHFLDGWESEDRRYPVDL